MSGQLKTYHDAVKTKSQHKQPCSDCPFSRKSLPGWLGSMNADEWVQAVHGEALIDCHTTDKQCAGAAIYRANNCKVPRDRTILQLPANRQKVFASPVEFIKHHNGDGK
jgi:hypothetical protein